jgi:3-oxoacyl-[acyl-carrier-protein] synthase-3
MSAATVPVALCEAIEDGRVKPGSQLLMPAFGGGLTFCAHLVKWGNRSTPLGKSDADLAPQTRSALDIVQHYRKAKGHAVPF